MPKVSNMQVLKEAGRRALTSVKESGKMLEMIYLTPTFERKEKEDGHEVDPSSKLVRNLYLGTIVGMHFPLGGLYQILFSKEKYGANVDDIMYSSLLAVSVPIATNVASSAYEHFRKIRNDLSNKKSHGLESAL